MSSRSSNETRGESPALATKIAALRAALAASDKADKRALAQIHKRRYARRADRAIRRADIAWNRLRAEMRNIAFAVTPR